MSRQASGALKKPAHRGERDRAPAGKGSPLLYAWQLYNRFLAIYPILTKSLTCFFGATIGDLLAQAASGQRFDPGRNLRLSIFSLLYSGPTAHYWHVFLDSNLLPTRPKSLSAVLLKMVLDQALYAPFSTAVLFAFLEAAKGTPDLIWPVLQEKFWPALRANYLLWPLANLIAFRFLSADMRILYCNVIGVLWCAYFSLLFNKVEHTK